MAKKSIRRSLNTKTIRSLREGGKAAQAAPVLLGITKASLEHRFVYLGGLLPRYNARSYRCSLRRQDRLSAAASKKTSSWDTSSQAERALISTSVSKPWSIKTMAKKSSSILKMLPSHNLRRPDLSGLFFLKL